MAQSDVKECAGFVMQKSFFVYIRLFLWSSDIKESRHPPCANTTVIKVFNEDIKTEDLLTPHMDPTFLSLRLLWWCHENGILRYPSLTDVFQISQRNIYHKFLLKIVNTTYTPMILTLSNISLIPPSFSDLGWCFQKLNADITCVITSCWSMHISDVILRAF
jgi:hypothetical protein